MKRRDRPGQSKRAGAGRVRCWQWPDVLGFDAALVALPLAAARRGGVGTGGGDGPASGSRPVGLAGLHREVLRVLAAAVLAAAPAPAV